MNRREFIGLSGYALMLAALPRFALADAGNAADQKLSALLNAIFDGLIDNSPETATSLGLDKGPRAALKSKLDVYTKAEQARMLAQTKAWRSQLRAMDRKSLSK